MADIVQDYTKKCCSPHKFGCPLYIHNTKKACFVRLRGCPYAPIHLDPHVWMPPVCLDAPYVWMGPLYVWMPHMPPSKHVGESKYTVGASKHMGVSKHRGIQT